MKEIVQKFTVIKDPRHSGYIKYKLADVLSIIMCAVLCGLDDLESLHVFAESNRSLWEERLGLTSVPSKSTVGRILNISATKKRSSIKSNMLSYLLDHNRFLNLLEFL